MQLSGVHYLRIYVPHQKEFQMNVAEISLTKIYHYEIFLSKRSISDLDYLMSFRHDSHIQY